jgi:hypothetical protein
VLCFVVDGTREITTRVAHATLLLDSDQSDRGADGEPQGAKLALHDGLETQPFTRPASKLKRPGGSERNFVGEINALLHGYWPGSFGRNHGARGYEERNEGIWVCQTLARANVPEWKSEMRCACRDSWRINTKV